MNVEKFYTVILLSLFLFSSQYTATSYEDDLVAMFGEDHLLIEQYLNSGRVIKKSFGLSPADIFAFLTSTGLLDPFINIFKEDLFLRTNPINKRDIIDMPLGMTDKKYAYKNWTLGAELFWNKVDRSYFSQHCDHISSYLAICKGSLLEKLDVIAKKAVEFGFSEEFDDPLDILLLFKNGTVQLRRIGFLFQGLKQSETFNFRFKLPFLYMESNYYFTKKEEKAIEKKLGVAGEEEKDRLAQKHMISDKLGFGDLRMTFDYPLTDNTRFVSRLGLHLTIPTAWALASGLHGSHFCPICPSDRPILDLTEILSLAEDATDLTDAFKVMEDFLYKALDHMSANLIDFPLGNGGHFGAGAVFNSQWPLNLFIKRPWTDNIVMKGRISLEYLFPRTETRYYIECLNYNSFDNRDFAVTDPADPEQSTRAMENIIFLQDRLTDIMFPLAYKTKVSPGFVFRWTSKAAYETDRWGLHLGTDTWVRTEEKLSDICLNDLNKIDRLKINKARKMMAYQAKLLASVFFKKHKDGRDWILSLNADTTYWTSGIGYDWSLAFNFEVNF